MSFPNYYLKIVQNICTFCKEEKHVVKRHCLKVKTRQHNWGGLCLRSLKVPDAINISASYLLLKFCCFSRHLTNVYALEEQLLYKNLFLTSSF